MSADAASGRVAQIVHTAANLFDKRGYANTAMEDIAEAVGLAKPTLYHYISSKDEVLYQIHQDFMDIVLAAMSSRSTRNMTAADQLRSIMIDIVALMRTHRPMVRVFFEHLRDLPAVHRAQIIQQRKRYRRRVEAVIKRGIRSGEFRRVDPSLTALGIFGMCNWAYQWFDPKGKLSAETIGARFAELVLRGIEARVSSR